MKCGISLGVILIEHAMTIAEKALEKRLRKIVTIDDMQFGLIPVKGTIDAVIILRRIQEEYIAKQKKLYMCFVDRQEVMDRVPGKVVEWAMGKKGIPESKIRTVMSLYKDKSERWNTSI